MTASARNRHRGVRGDGGSDPRRLARRRLRQVAIDDATAQVLERCADRSGNPTLAEILRERADERRRRAERLRPGSRAQRPVT
jgi:hypothetical protein